MTAGKRNSIDNRIAWVNGLKGLACLMVFFHHFFLPFYPGIYYGKASEAKTLSGIDILLGYKPFGFLVNGNFAVCIFVMVSAFLFAMKTIKDDESKKNTDLLNICIQRYLRLMPPVAVVSVIYYLLIKVLSANGLNYTNIQSELSVFGLVKHIFFYQWIIHDSSLLGPLWCMYILFIGSFVAIFLSKFSKRERKYMPLVYLIASVALLVINRDFMPVGLGVLLADLYCNGRIKVKKATGYILGIVAILAGLFLGGYPSAATPENPVYLIMQKLPGDMTLSHSVGAFLLFFGIMLLPKKPVLSSKCFGFIGNISFSVYLIQSVIINLLSYYLADTFEKITGSYSLGVWISFAITAILLIVLSVLFTEFVEKKISVLTKKIKLK